MAETPPKKEAAKAAKEGASPEPFSPSKRSHTDFFSVDGFQVEDDAPPEKRLKSNDPGDGGAASEAQGVGGHDLGANNGASEDSADGESRGGGEDTDEENQASSNDDDEDDDDGGGDGGGGSEEEEEEPVCTDCGEQPCMFEEFVPNLIALSIENGCRIELEEVRRE
jgi:hypothetical protein